MALLSRFDARKKTLNKPRRELYEALAAVMTVPQLTTAIREFMQESAELGDVLQHMQSRNI